MSMASFTIKPLIMFLGPSDSVGIGLEKVTVTDMQPLQVSILRLRSSLDPAESFDTADCSLLLEIFSSFGSKDVTPAWFSSDLMGNSFPCPKQRALPCLDFYSWIFPDLRYHVSFLGY